MAGKKSFETALHKLEEAVAKLESGDLSLDQSLKVFTDGVKQADICRKSLAEVELQVELLLKQDDGRFQREDFDDER